MRANKQNEELMIGPRNMQEVCIEVPVNKRTNRLPVIVIQTPAEVEAGLFSYWSSDETSRNQDNNKKIMGNSNELSFAVRKQRNDTDQFEEPTENCATSFGQFGLEPARSLAKFQFKTKASNCVEFENEWKTKMPVRKGRSTRSKVKKSAASEQKNVLEDTLFAFKKMKLHREEMDDDDYMD